MVAIHGGGGGGGGGDDDDNDDHDIQWKQKDSHKERKREDRKEACRCLPVFLFSDICFISSPSTAHVNDQEAPSFGSGGAV